MSGKSLYLVLVMALALSGILARGQRSPSQIPKKARTLADYETSTLREIVAIDSDDEKLPEGSRASNHSDLIPFRVSVIYTGATRPISGKSKDALFRWAQCCAGNPDGFTGPYDTEMRFDEDKVAYWLAVRKRSLPDFEKELKNGQPVNLYLIRVAARRTDGKPGSALLVERFSAAVENRERAQCLIEPPYPVMEVPPLGIVSLKREGIENDCRPARKIWLQQAAPAFDVFVHADGPSGSGRYWNVTVGIAGKGRRMPDRGFCFATSTVGWRTLQNFDKPLVWVADEDHDGKPELILWDSFPLNGKDSSAAEFGITSWVYQIDSKGRFTIDWGLSRKLAGELGAAYRRPLQQDSTLLRGLRQQAAQALESFAAGSCKEKES